MATKMTGLRLSEDTIREIYFLGVLGGQTSQAKTVAEWIHTVAAAVKAQALAMNPGTRDDKEFLMNGGTIISVEEQRAMAALRKTLRDFGGAGIPG
jgi:hypothetical protein